MIAKMKSNLSVKETLLYNDREMSEIIFIKNLTGENIRDVEKQMALRQKLFIGRAKNLTAHIIISPSIEDGKRQTRLDWKLIGSSFLEKAGLKSYQSIAYLHKDKEHFHLHIVSNRIDVNGKIYRHKNELAMSQRIGDEIAIERGLTRASEIRRQGRLKLEKRIGINPEVGIVAQIKKVAAKASFMACMNGEFDQMKYFECIKAEGLEVRLFFKKDSNEVRGYAIGKKGDRLINASQIGNEFTLRRLKQGVDGAKYSVGLFNSEIRDVIDTSFQKTTTEEKRFDPHLFLNELRRAGYTVIEYFNRDSGQLRGYGFQLEGEIINASEIGPEFTLTKLKRRFEQHNQSHERQRNSHKITSQKPKHGPKEDISRDLRRAIDIRLISSELYELTNGHHYQSPDDFIRAIEEKGYHVHLRYGLGSLSGYTLHKGTEHYHDWELANGEFQLPKLIKRKKFRDFHIPTYGDSVQTSETIIAGELAKDDDQTQLHNKVPKSSDKIFSHFFKLDSKKNKDLKREKIRQLIASELAAHIHTFTEKRKSFSDDKYLNTLEGNGYKITKHFDKTTGSTRGYSLERDGFHFHASEVGKEFTLKSIRQRIINDDKEHKERLRR